MIYLCGGINGLSDSDCKNWREVAKGLLKEETLDPMRRDYRGKEDESVNEIVMNDLEDIAVSRALLVNGTKASWGTAMELVYAKILHKPIFVFVGNSRVSPWLRFHATAICITLEECCQKINDSLSRRSDNA